MQKIGLAIAVSYLEWIRWIATGWFRCADRVVWLDGPDDQAGVDAMMDRGPDLQVADDQGFVIARLRAESLGLACKIESNRLFGHALLPLEIVEEFLPLSSRGARLLEADAERAGVRLGVPVFERSWSHWRDRRLQEEAHRRGILLCKAMGLEVPVLADLPTESSEILAGRQLAPNAEKSRGSALEGTRSFGWAAALSVGLMVESVREAVRNSDLYSAIQSNVKILRGDYDLRRPLLADDRMVALSIEMDASIREHGGTSPQVAAMAVVLHFRDIASSGRELALYALLEDLATIAREDPQAAGMCAYFIGRSMENVAVTTLLYQSNPARFKALIPRDSKEKLNVMRRVAERLEAEQATVPVPGSTEHVRSTPGPVAPDLSVVPGSPSNVSTLGAESTGEVKATESEPDLGGDASSSDAGSALAGPISVVPNSGPLIKDESTPMEPIGHSRPSIAGDQAAASAIPEGSIQGRDSAPTDLFAGTQSGVATSLVGSADRKSRKRR